MGSRVMNSCRRDLLRGRALKREALGDAKKVDDIEVFCAEPPAKKLAAVYAVYAQDGKVRYVGIARDIHSALISHLTSQPVGECARVAFDVFDRPSREAMGALQQSWLAELPSVPIGNDSSNSEETQTWSKPPLSADQALKKLKMRQAVADGSLQQEDPEAWQAVVKKAMKDGDFDGSAADLLDASIDADEMATRRDALKRAAGDWQGEIESQTAETLKVTARPAAAGQMLHQIPRLEIYSAPGCPHCHRMKAALEMLGASFVEYNVEAESAADDSEEVVRRARHARFNTVPQLYVLREPPLRGRQPERLIGGADELASEISKGIFQSELSS